MSNDIEEIEELDLAEHIKQISAAMNKLTASGLNRKAVIVLLNHTSKVGMRDIEYVLNSLDILADRYTK